MAEESPRVGEGGTRRERLRESTVDEILDVARRHVVASGPQAVSMRAIARDMGMTAPALYRYFASLDDLVGALIASLYRELTDAMEQARDTLDPGDLGGRLLAVCRAFRRWAMAHPGEFGLIFGSPIPGVSSPHEGPGHEEGMRFGGVFAALFTQLWRVRPFPVPADDEVDPRLAAQLREYGERLGLPLPVGALQVFMSAWVRLYGTVSMEVFGHMEFAVADGEPLFEVQLRDLGDVLCIADAYRPPG
jgi:AcrR family transcriptional regulator